MMKTPEGPPTVIFDWNHREGSSWWLSACIFLSFLLHSATFFLFQGRSAGPARAPRTAPIVQLLLPSPGQSPENEALLQWIATQDPALVARVETVQPAGLTEVTYRPSFAVIRTQPLVNPPEPPVVRLPPARDPAALVRSLTAIPRPVPPVQAQVPTTLSLSEALGARLPEVPQPAPRSKAGATVQPSIVLVGVAKDGEPRFSFLQQSSGSPALDAEASAFIGTLRFTPGAVELQWGTITFEWGDEVTGPPAPGK